VERLFYLPSGGHDKYGWAGSLASPPAELVFLPKASKAAARQSAIRHKWTTNFFSPPRTSESSKTVIVRQCCMAHPPCKASHVAIIIHRSTGSRRAEHSSTTKVSSKLNLRMASSSTLDPRLRENAVASSYSNSQRPPKSSLPTPLAPNTSRSPHSQYSITPASYPSAVSPHAQSPYLQHTPQSGGNVTDNEVPNDGSHDGGPNDPKRPRACEACRGLKVRCEPDPNNPDGPCKRCNKANRNCVVTVPSRKRQKKTDSRVAELEKKINALTDALTEKLQAQPGSVTLPAGSESSLDQVAINTPNPYQQVTNGGYGSFGTGRPDVGALG